MRYLLLLSMLTVLASCKQPKELSTFTYNWDALADQIIKQADLQPGERILLIAQPGTFDLLIPLLKARIMAAQSEFLGAMSTDSISQPVDWQTEFTKGAIGKNPNELSNYFEEVDLGIMLPGAAPIHVPYAALQEVLRRGKGRTIHFHWAGAYDLSGTPLEVTDSISSYYQRVLLQTDYPLLTRIQSEFEVAARKDTIHVTTPEGTDIHFFIGDRPVTKQDGDASNAHMATARNLVDREIELPAGAIRVAPIEESVFGEIAFPNAMWNGQPVEGLIVTFDAGKIINMTASKGLEAVQAELKKAGEAGNYFREFAMGFNPLLSIPNQDPWIPYYGYGAGIVRLSLGDNSELGGKVTGGYVRWNFFTNATVVIGEDTWVENGKLIK
jgi:hypothetical protein